MGVIITITSDYLAHDLSVNIWGQPSIYSRKLNNQFEHVESALAFARVLIGDISAGYSYTPVSHILLGTKKRAYPRKWQPRRAKASDVGKQPDCCTFCSAWRAGDETGKDKHHAQALTNRTPEEEISASRALYDEPTNRCKYRVDDHIHSTE